MFIIWRLAERIDTKPAQAHNFNFYFNFTLKSWSSGKGYLRILDGVKQIKGGNE
jgi:predicted AlkP superfamily phosphohydrolase/phosphomutase